MIPMPFTPNGPECRALRGSDFLARILATPAFSAACLIALFLLLALPTAQAQAPCPLELVPDTDFSLPGFERLFLTPQITQTQPWVLERSLSLGESGHRWFRIEQSDSVDLPGALFRGAWEPLPAPLLYVNFCPNPKLETWSGTAPVTVSAPGIVPVGEGWLAEKSGTSLTVSRVADTIGPAAVWTLSVSAPEDGSAAYVYFPVPAAAALELAGSRLLVSIQARSPDAQFHLIQPLLAVSDANGSPGIGNSLGEPQPLAASGGWSRHGWIFRASDYPELALNGGWLGFAVPKFNAPGTFRVTRAFLGVVPEHVQSGMAYTGMPHQSVRATVATRLDTGMTEVSWQSLADPALRVTKQFTTADFDLRTPGAEGTGQSVRHAFDTLNAPARDGVPAYLFMLSLAGYPQGAPVPPAASGPLQMPAAGAAPSAALDLQLAESFRLAALPDATGTSPLARALAFPTAAPAFQPSPLSENTRSQFRLRTRTAPAMTSDAPNIPQALRNLALTPRASGVPVPHLILTAACFANYSGPLLTDTVAGVSRTYRYDWVEVTNASAVTLATDSYCIEDKPLPAMLLEPGQTVRLFLSNNPDALPGVIPESLDDDGEVVRLCYQTATDLLEVDSLSNPDAPGATGLHGGLLPLTDLIWGRWIAPDGNLHTRFFRQEPQTGSGGVAGLSSYTHRMWAWREVAEPPAVNEVTAAGALIGPARGGLSRSTAARFISFTPPVETTDMVVYTLNATEPDESSTVWDGQPVPLPAGSSTIVRARTVRRPAQTGEYAEDALLSPVITRTFLHTPAALFQQVNQAAYHPEVNLSAGWWEDPTPTAARLAQQYGYSAPPPRAGFTAPAIVDQLESIPSIAITWSHLASATFNGGDDPEFSCAFEWINPAHPADYAQENAIIQRSGFSSLDSQKRSWDILFKKQHSLRGASRWQGPVNADETTTAFPTSRVFPGSRVSAFHRLLLRNPGVAAFRTNNIQTGTPPYFITDAWLKETQRAIATPDAILPQRRWVHLWLNGAYWGVFDLQEKPDATFISDHLIRKLGKSPAPTPAQIAALQPEQVEFYGGPQSGTTTPASVDENSPRSLHSLREAAGAAATADRNTGNPPAEDLALWNAFLSKIDLDDYISYLTTLQFCWKADHDSYQVKAWRHPADGRWRFIAWDGDSLDVGLYDGIGGFFGLAWSEELFAPIDQQVHLWMRSSSVNLERSTVTRYADAFIPRLNTLLAGTGSPLSPSAVHARLNDLVESFRPLLEAEVMRWGSPSAETETDWENAMFSPESYQDLIPAVNDGDPFTANARQSVIRGALPHGLTTLTP